MVDQRELLDRMGGEDWSDDSGEALPECYAVVRIGKGWRFEDAKFPPERKDGSGRHEPYPQLTGRVRVVAASNPLAVGGGAWVRLDYPPVDYPGIDIDQIEMRRGTEQRCLGAILAGDVKGAAAKKARVQERWSAAGDIGVALADKTAIVKVTVYSTAGGDTRNRFNQWYPDTPENQAKYLKAGTAGSGSGPAAEV